MLQSLIQPKVRPWVCVVDAEAEKAKADVRRRQHDDLFYRGVPATFDYKKMKELSKNSLSQ